MQKKSESNQNRSVFVTVRILERLQGEAIPNLLKRKTPENKDLIFGDLSQMTMGGEAYLSYAEFSEYVTKKNSALVSALNRCSRERPILVATGDQRVFTEDGGYTNASKDYYLATYVVELKIPNIVPLSKISEFTYSPFSNAYGLPQGIQFTEDQIVGFWSVNHISEYLIVMFSEPGIRAIEANEMAIWGDLTQEGVWIYQCGPNGNPKILDIDHANIEEINKPWVYGNLELQKARADRYNGISYFAEYKRFSTPLREVNRYLLNIAVADGNLPENLSINYHFPKVVQCASLNNLEEDYTALKGIFGELERSYCKIKSKKEFLAWHDKFEQATKLCEVSDDYAFRKMKDHLKDLQIKFLDANGRFCQSRDILNTLKALREGLDLKEGFSWPTIDHLSSEDNSIATIYSKHNQHSQLLNRYYHFRNKDIQKVSNYEELEAFDFKRQLKKLCFTAATYTELLQGMELLLAERWEQIRKSDLIYTKTPEYNEMNKLCLMLAKLLFQFRKGEKNLYQYLMPTIIECYDSVTELSLSDLKLNQFVLDENQEYGFNLQTLYNHHTYAQGDSQAQAGALMNPYIPYTEEVPGVAISDLTLLNMIHHSTQTEAYHQAYEDWMEALASQDEASIHLGPVLKALADGLRSGSVLGTGSEYVAGPEAMEAIQTFSTFLETLSSEDTKFLFELKSIGFNQNFQQMWDILTQKDTKSLSCVKILSDKITAILNNPKYQELLFGADIKAKHKAFEKAGEKFQQAFNKNIFELRPTGCPIDVKDFYLLIAKNQKFMPQKDLISLLNSLNIPRDCQFPSKAMVQHAIEGLSQGYQVNLETIAPTTTTTTTTSPTSGM